MNGITWTGNPFVDAGLSAIAAVTGVSRLEDLNFSHLEKAVQELERVLLSDQALGVGMGKSFAKGKMSQLFPNSELVNPSNWKGSSEEKKADSVRHKFKEALRQDLRRAGECFSSPNGDVICFTCGQKRPVTAMDMRRKDKMPLFEGIVNYYSALSWGISMCGICNLAVRFLPLAVMYTGYGGQLWFLHIQSLPVASSIARIYGWQHFDSLISLNQVIDFYGNWKTVGGSATVIFLLGKLLTTYRNEMREVYRNPVPAAAYIFRNDNRTGYVETILVPNELFRFLQQLEIEDSNAYKRFFRELIEINDNLDEKEKSKRMAFVREVAARIIGREPIVGICLDKDNSTLRGGWLAHRLYLLEVRKMDAGRLSTLERLAVNIVEDKNASRFLSELLAAQRQDLYGIFLRYVRKGWLSHEDFYHFLAPNDFQAAGELRDILLAVAWEYQRCVEEGTAFEPLSAVSKLEPDAVLEKIREIGEKLLNKLSNPYRWMMELFSDKRADRIRSLYLNAVRYGALSFNDFVFLAPWGDRQSLYLKRDYLLAYLFDRGRSYFQDIDQGIDWYMDNEDF